MGFSCNNKCKFCVQGNKRATIGDKTANEIKNSVKKARETCDIIVFTGGEPTIRRELLDLVKYAADLKYKIIQIQTNGRMFAYRDYCKSLVGAGANEFSPAIHGHIEELHDYLTNTSGSFRQVVAGIKNLKSLGQSVITNTVITKPNYRNLPNIANLLVSLSVDQFQFAFVHPIGSAWENFESIVPRKSLAGPYIKKGLDAGIKAKTKVMTEAIPYCFMEGYEKYIAEIQMPDIAIFDEHGYLESFKKARVIEGKAKGPDCKKCKYFKVCEGPWKEYPEKLGWDEFKPIL